MALFCIVIHLEQKQFLRFSPVSGHLLPRAIITPSGVGRDDYLAKWSVSVLMILNETLASAITKADIYISILEEYVKGF